MEEKLKNEGRDPNTWKEWFLAPTGTAEKQYGEWNLPEDYHMNTWIAERTNVIMEKFANNDKPFMLWASFFDPHPPYIVSGKWAHMYNPSEMNIPEMNIINPLYESNKLNYDILITRAFGNIKRILKTSKEYLKSNNIIICYKGKINKVFEEINGNLVKEKKIYIPINVPFLNKERNFVLIYSK